MESLATLGPLGRVYKRPLQREFRQRWDLRSQRWDDHLASGLWFSQSVAPWLDQAWLEESVPIRDPPPNRELYTDAAPLDGEAHMGSFGCSCS